MPFEVSERYHAAVIHIKGKFFGSIDGERFKAQLAQLRDAGKRHVVVDLSDAELMDSSGIGVLIGGLMSMRKQGGEIRLAAMHKRIRNLFLMTRLLGTVFQDYETVDDALESFKTNPPEPAPAASEE